MKAIDLVGTKHDGRCEKRNPGWYKRPTVCTCRLAERQAAARAIDERMEALEEENERLRLDAVMFIGGQSG